MNIFEEYKNTKSHKAYTEIFNKHYKALFVFLNNNFKIDRNDIEDIAIMSFHHAMNKIDQFDHTKNFKTWLYTIGRNMALKHLQKTSRYINTNFEGNFDETDKTTFIAQNLLASNEIKVDENKFNQEYDELIDEIQNLKPEIREVFIDSYLSNMTFDQIMNKYSLSESKVKMKLLTGRKDIRKSLFLKKLTSYNKCEEDIHPIMNKLIYKLKYCGEINENLKYHFKKNKVNTKTVMNFIENYNKEVAKSNYNSIIYDEISNCIDSAKKIFENNISSFDEKYSLPKEELEKAKSLNYCVDVVGYKTRDGKGEFKLKVNKLEKAERQRQIKFIDNKCMNNYLLSITEDNHFIYINNY